MVNDSSRRLLALTYYYPPIKSIASVRSRNFVQQATRHFQAVHVFTTRNRRALPSDDYAPAPGIRPVALPTLDFRTIFPKPAVKYKAGGVNTLYNLLNSFPFDLLAGIGGLVYIFSGVIRGMFHIRRHRITHLYSSYFPYADHYTAFVLTLFFPRLVWIADFRDLRVDPARPEVVWPRLQQWIDRQVLRRASMVTTVSNGLATHLRQIHPRVHVLRNAIPEELLRLTPKREVPEKFTITYTGNLYAGKRDPRYLFRTLQDLIAAGELPKEELQLRYAGSNGADWLAMAEEFGLAECATDLGMLPYAEALRFQRESSVNLLLSWSSPESQGILTGKFYEYIAARRPILLILSGTTDPEFEQLFEEHALGCVSYDRAAVPDAALEAFLREQYLNWKNAQQSILSAEAGRYFSWSRGMDDLIKQLD